MSGISIGDIVLIIIIIITAVFINSALSLVLHTDTPLAVVSSWSMDPTLHVGDLIVVYGGKVEIGEPIIFMRSDGRYVVHRVVAERDGCFITKGDANISPDFTPVCDKNIKGKVLFVIPYMGTLKLFFERILGMG